MSFVLIRCGTDFRVLDWLDSMLKQSETLYPQIRSVWWDASEGDRECAPNSEQGTRFESESNERFRSLDANCYAVGLSSPEVVREALF